MEDKTNTYKRALFSATLDVQALKELYNRLLKFKSPLIESGVNELLIDSLAGQLDMLGPFYRFTQTYNLWESTQEKEEEKGLKNEIKQFKKIIKSKIKLKQIVEEIIDAYSLSIGKFETKELSKFKKSIADLTKHFSHQFDQINKLEKDRGIEVDLLFSFVKIKKNKEKEPNDNLNETITKKIKEHEDKLVKINSEILVLRERLDEDVEQYMAYDIGHIYNLAKKAMQKEIKLEAKVHGYEDVMNIQKDVENIIVLMSDLEQKQLKIESERENLHDRGFREEEYGKVCNQIAECQKNIKNRQGLIIQMAAKLSNPFRTSIEKDEVHLENCSLKQEMPMMRT